MSQFFFELFSCFIFHLMNVQFRLLVVENAVKPYWFDFLIKELTELQAIGFFSAAHFAI